MGSNDKDSAWFNTKPYANKTSTRGRESELSGRDSGNSVGGREA